MSRRRNTIAHLAVGKGGPSRRKALLRRSGERVVRCDAERGHVDALVPFRTVLQVVNHHLPFGHAGNTGRAPIVGSVEHIHKFAHLKKKMKKSPIRFLVPRGLEQSNQGVGFEEIQGALRLA